MLWIALKAKFDKLEINELVNFPTSLNNLKRKNDDLDVCKLGTVSLDLKKISDVEDNDVDKNTAFNKLKTKINNL